MGQVRRGFGVAGALDHSIAAELARAAERAGYCTFWANDTPDGDGLAALAAAATVTTTIQLGVGVIPIDRQPAAEISAKIERLGLPQERIILGIGSGSLTAGARDAVRDNALSLRESTQAKIVVGALGPRMCEIGGVFADGALLNWLTPAYTPVLASIVRQAAVEHGRSGPWIGAYVRVALAGAGADRLAAEAGRYARYPQYAAHFSRMGVEAVQTAAYGDAAAIQAGLNAYTADLDEVVVRAIAASETPEDYLQVLQAAAPGEGAES